ncbi:glycosyltransferase family 2 protein [Pedococcus sp. KACC 23699]|uniref:Glycosyltransferase family 2 protein n=1 Tax=Pedococcus sp. KACC 23699 TaxID=3149228 RepID=A0AAU7JWX0_9MICO
MAERLTVAVPTFRRNDDLRELVPLLVDHATALRERDGMEVRVLLVDNDPEGGARPVVESLGRDDVVYVHEPEPGLAAVRQRALDESTSWDLLAFLDDDGRPAPQWLAALVDTWRHTGAAAVAGKVVEHYLTPPSSWIVAGGFFRRRSLPTGTVVPSAPTTNLFLDLRQVRDLGMAFDRRFGLSGGEDTFFTSQLTARGGRIVWCEESQVVDQVPTDRMSPSWVLRRAWSHGNTTAIVNQALAATARARHAVRVRDVAGGVLRCLAGLARFVLGVVTRSQERRAKGLRTAARGLGMASGSFGAVFEEYSR